MFRNYNLIVFIFIIVIIISKLSLLVNTLHFQGQKFMYKTLLYYFFRLLASGGEKRNAGDWKTSLRLFLLLSVLKLYTKIRSTRGSETERDIKKEVQKDRMAVGKELQKERETDIKTSTHENSLTKKTIL